MKKETVRYIFGFIWLAIGLLKIPAFSMAPKMMEKFAQTCLIEFYANFIKEFIVPNAIFIYLLVILFQVITGLLILSFGIRAKIGLIFGILMNLSFLPLGIPQIFVNTIFIVFQTWLLLKGNFERSFFERFRK